ncbi:MAG TPA: DUF4013 domain-containing protein [Anaerolineae bacterium]|nr:DUF4013 domain-containing protein [Anaerolineae bacterium]
MTTSFTSDDFKKLVAFPFQDADWKNKFLIGSLVLLAGYLLLIPIALIYGYTFQIMRGIIVEKREPFMPAWDDWGKLFGDGFKLLGVYLVYSLPLLLFLCGSYVALFGLIAGRGVLAEASPDEPSPLVALVPVLGVFGWIACLGLVFVFALALGLVMPAALSHVVATNEFNAAFRFGEWWAIFRANLAGFVLAFVVVLAISVAFNFAMQILYLTIIGCCFIPFLLIFMGFYLLLVSNVIFAQAYRDGVEKLAWSG